MKTHKLSNKVENIQGSKSIQMAAIVEKLKAEGKKIISMSVGEPDFETPEIIKQSVKDSLDKGLTRYSLVSGLKELRSEIAFFLNEERGFRKNINLTSDNIIVSNGSKQSLYNIFQILCNPGDEIIVPVPYWVTIPESIKLAGGIPVFVATKNLQLDLQLIKRAINKKTKAIVYNSPNNPSGRVYPKEILIELGNLAINNDLYLVSDEAYDSLIYDNLTPFSLASYSKYFFEKVLTVQTFSKSYCMTGFRIGYVAAPTPLVLAMDKLQGHITGNNCTFSQSGAIAALKMDQTEIKNMIKKFEKRRNLALEKCREIFSCEKPQGAFYLFPKVDNFFNKDIANDEKLCEFILEKAHVAVLPGSAFGQPGHLRFSFACSEQDIIDAFKQIKKVLL